MAKKGQYVFYCHQHPSYLLWSGTRFLEFKQGVLVTDEMGAAALKRHPMFGRLFLETPPDPVVDPHPELRLADMLVVPTNTVDCPECDETFTSRHLMERHRQDTHQIFEPDDQVRQEVNNG